ncbi:MAG: hypothetical protein K8L97_09850 [Anaerolineae bacterium]|nr:hypothetical protein [Anaerolineae bacterium]
MTLELSIVKGIPIPPGSTSTAEVGLDVIDLLNASGFSVQIDSWIPVLAAPKNGGVWSESVLGGDRLLAAEPGRVTETMTLIASAATPRSRHFLERRLSLFGELSRKQHTTNYQVEPVYLKLQLDGMAGPQFSLLYSIEIAPDADPFRNRNLNQLTIALIRHPEWTWQVPPGVSPKGWTIYRRGLTDTLSNYNLASNLNNLLQPTGGSQVDNATVLWLNSSVEAYYTRSFLDIPAADVPGDRPARVQLTLGGEFAKFVSAPNTFYVHSLYIGRRSRSQAGLLETNRLAAKCGGTGAKISAALGLDTTYQGDYGVIDDHATSTASYYASTTPHNRARCTFTTTPTVFRPCVTWTGKMAALSGRFLAFARCHQSGGTAGDIELYLQYGYDGDDLETSLQNPAVQAVATHTQFWPVLNLGVITLPPDAMRVPVGDNGRGIDPNAQFTIRLQVRRKSGVGEFYFADITLIPIDECAVKLSLEQYVNASYTATQIFYDNTGYFTRGQDDPVAYDKNLAVGAPGKAAELAGADILLEPNTDNRLYCFFTGNVAGSSTIGVSPISTHVSITDKAVAGVTVRGNLVPRSLGLRDA